MHYQALSTVTFTIAAGIFALILGNKTRLPSILFLLLFGIFLGPHFANIVQPSIFRAEFPQYISILVSLILFEGGASLKFSQFHDISGTLRRLLTFGMILTLILVSAAAHFIVKFSWTKSILFGAIMIVTGPTVVLPILQRLRVKEKLHNILKWEAILIDPLGVVAAVVLFEFLLSKHSVWQGMASFTARIALGSALGLFAGWFMYLGLTRKSLLRLEGEELGGLFVLACNLLFYALAERILPESGLVVATVAGIFLGNKKFALQEQILHFKKQLTLLALSGLFILLSSNVPIGKIKSVWVEGSWLLLFLVLVARPLSVFLSTLGDKQLNFREKAFLSFLAPRGIVSASLASLFAIAFEERALSRGGIFLPLAFYVITGSIIFYALLGGIIARLLKVLEEDDKTVVLVGANPVGFLFGGELKKRGYPVKFIDTNPYCGFEARSKNFEAFTGSGFDHEFLEALDLKGVHTMLALTPNHEVNVLTCQCFSRYLGRDRIYRLWDKSDQWENLTSDSYDDSRGKPIWVPQEASTSGLWEVIRSGKFEISSRKLESATRVLPENLKTWGDIFPLFGVLQNKLYFLTPKTVLPEGAEIVGLKAIR